SVDRGAGRLGALRAAAATQPGWKAICMPAECATCISTGLVDAAAHCAAVSSSGERVAGGAAARRSRHIASCAVHDGRASAPSRACDQPARRREGAMQAVRISTMKG
ncbi:MAG: hypothetical protein ABW128_02570, partial [Rhizorhabdus sp.]